ncbi:hypothetical protein Tsubulata_039066 [Turnera subulata]|uniref:procollagen-proline 4-dioxygenase n=1 Tax=Turnera subulata TaxID=218843 RepID=A0A9Q0GC81_9ROSI|nr:hypothetical protein Tsubulata_039066 [Turnera subulata]
MEPRYFILLPFCFLIFSRHLSISSQNMYPSLFYMGGSVLELKRSVLLSNAFDPTRVSLLSWQPRIFVYKGFLSEEECDHLINLAGNELQISMVVDEATGASVQSEDRTSTGMFLGRGQDEIIANIEARIAAWTLIPEENGEMIQVLRYEKGQKYEPHVDYFLDEFNTNWGGQRIATVLMYLSYVDEGGETVFPESMAKTSQEGMDDNWSDCAKTGFAVKPEKGDALLFFSLHPNATADPKSVHGSCPVIKGEKWSATKWIHVRPLENAQQEPVLRLKRGVSANAFDPTRVTQLSWHPRAFLYKGFLSDEECDHLVDLAKDKLEKSMVADNESGKSIESEVRTSSGMFLQKAQDEIVAAIENRISAWTFLPIENGESMQILHYEHGQKYEPHFDYFHDKANLALGGHRIATVLMYLSNVQKGGETVFPNSEGKMSQPKDDSWSECAKSGYAGMDFEPWSQKADFYMFTLRMLLFVKCNSWV